MMKANNGLSLGLATVVQILLALVLCLGILFCLGTVEQNGILGVVGSTSLGSSLFIMLSMPNCNAAHPKRVIGSYLIGLLVGAAFYYISLELIVLQKWLDFEWVYILTGGTALAMTMIIMIFSDLSHPPAVGLALGVVFDPWNWWTLMMILACIVMLVVIKIIISPWLRNLRYRSQ